MSSAGAREDGFTIVEVVAASFVLLVGMLGVLTLLTGALRTTSVNITRVGATNLARELVERTRSLDYDDMTGATVQARLQAAGLGSGSPWTIVRRGVTYTVDVSSCTFDDPTDNLASPPPAGVCTPQPAAPAGSPDPNGEDFRRTTFRLSWVENGGAHRSVSQSTLVVNPSGGLGPRITTFTPVAQWITANVSSVSIVWTTTPATTLRWVADDGVSSGSSTGTTSFTSNWDIGSSGSGSEVFDGGYEITAQPFDDRDIAGEAKRANVYLNRRVPYAPQSLAGGHDTRLSDWVDLEWPRNRERDILGYRVYWAGADKTAGTSDDAQVCPPAGDSSPLDATSCTDTAPPSGSTKYYIVALDRSPSTDPAHPENFGPPREGDPQALSVGAAGSRPDPPTGLTVTTTDTKATLNWSAPASGGVSFYRIYRGTDAGLDKRYGRTAGTGTTFSDDTGGVSRTYWVTTVDSSYNESDPVGPVTTP